MQCFGPRITSIFSVTVLWRLRYSIPFVSFLFFALRIQLVALHSIPCGKLVNAERNLKLGIMSDHYLMLQILALLARYHRKKVPSQKDEDFAKLPEEVSLRTSELRRPCYVHVLSNTRKFKSEEF